MTQRKVGPLAGGLLPTGSMLAGRLRTTAVQWWHNRLQECLHCRECKGPVTPWDSTCPTCGQHDPARLSVSAVVSLVLGLFLLAAILGLLVRAF
jgi:hypothetical protein